jgi:hypothetical protein
MAPNFKIDVSSLILQSVIVKLVKENVDPVEEVAWIIPLIELNSDVLKH